MDSRPVTDLYIVPQVNKISNTKRQRAMCGAWLTLCCPHNSQPVFCSAGKEALVLTEQRERQRDAAIKFSKIAQMIPIPEH